MGQHSNKIFQVASGRVISEEVWDDDADDWSDWEDDTGEFAKCADGWYWQWRRITDPEDIMGIPFGPLHGPFPDAATAETDERNSVGGLKALVGDADDHPEDQHGS